MENQKDFTRMEINEEEYLHVLSALSDVYISIHLFDLKANEVKRCKSNHYIEGWSAECEGAQNKVTHVMEMITTEAHIRSMLDFVDLSTLNTRMKGKSDISTVFQGKVNGWCRARFVAVDYGENGDLYHVIYTVENINEEKLRENHLLYLAQTDLMTGLKNRGTGEKQIIDLLEQKRPGAFCLFDIDRFKNINDTYGHKIGDLVIQAVAKCMLDYLREGDIIFRLGGDEFAAYILDLTDTTRIQKAIEKFLDMIDQIQIDGFSQKIVLSFGVSINYGESDFDTLYRKADKGVYTSKRNKDSSITVVE